MSRPRHLDRNAWPASPAAHGSQGSHGSHGAFEADGPTGSFGGLADVLEPDSEAVTSMRRLDVGAASVRARPSAPVARAPVQDQDFAFADTVFADELEAEAAPPSGPIYVSDAAGHTQCMTPLAFPLPRASAEVAFPTRLRVLLAHLRHGMRRSYEEMRELWAGTAEMVAGRADHDAPTSSLPFVVRRALALWSCFQWSRADVTRAAMIGLAVFVTAAAIGATTLDFGDDDDAQAASAASSTGVRSVHTLDQHTGKKLGTRSKR